MDILTKHNGQWIRNYEPLGGEIDLNGTLYDIRDVIDVYWEDAKEGSIKGYYEADELVITTKDGAEHDVSKDDLDAETLKWINEWVDPC